ncbi:MAG: hypothetical protein HGB18_00200 [Candidatus Moranbacteria bacterium]|nr:hypothetical protein [Candidatus Moranbacteria bacterium]
MTIPTKESAGDPGSDGLSLIANALGSVVSETPMRREKIGLSELLGRVRFGNLVDMRHEKDCAIIGADDLDRIVREHAGWHRFGRYDETFQVAILYYGFRLHDGRVIIFRAVRFDPESCEFEIDFREVFPGDETPWSREAILNLRELECAMWSDDASRVAADALSRYAGLLRFAAA